MRKKSLSKVGSLSIYGSKLNIRNYSSMTNNKLDPEFITGFVDGEGSFVVTIIKRPRHKTGWRIEARFQIGLNKNDSALLKLLQDGFKGAGVISEVGNVVMYRVTAISDLINIIIPHFEKYPLITKKQADFKLFKQIVELMKEKKHLTNEGLRDIVSIKAAINLGLSVNLLDAFSDVIPKERPIVPIVKSIRPNWFAGFSEGESCFYIDINKSSHTKTGFQVQLKFIISQHSRDRDLLNCFINYLGCGKYYSKSRGTGEFVIVKFSDIFTKIIPFFEKYSFKGIKLYNFLDFVKAANLIQNREHLKAEGIEQIIKIKQGMNRSRLGVRSYGNDSSKSFRGLASGYKKIPYYYMYNRDKSILYYSSQKLSDYNLLGIHFFTLKTHLKKESYYLGKYCFSKKYIDLAKQLKMSFFDVESMLIKDRIHKKNKK